MAVWERIPSMADGIFNPVPGVHRIHGPWGWFLALGIGLILLGASAIVFEVTATYATIVVFGWLLLVGGFLQLIHAFRTGNRSGFLLHLLAAVLRGFVGYLLVRYPLMGAETLTLLLGSFLIVGGLYRVAGAAIMKLPRWGWAVFAGAVAIGLGVLLLVQLPVSGLWFIGFVIGLDLAVDGAAIVALAMAIHHRPGHTVLRTA